MSEIIDKDGMLNYARLIDESTTTILKTAHRIEEWKMDKAKERALERFPVHEGASKEWIEKHLKGVCAEYIEGYHQAEKDYEPTLEDVEIILNAFLDFWIENYEQGKKQTGKEYCQEVLKRYLKERKEK